MLILYAVCPPPVSRLVQHGWGYIPIFLVPTNKSPVRYIMAERGQPACYQVAGLAKVGGVGISFQQSDPQSAGMRILTLIPMYRKKTEEKQILRIKCKNNGIP